MKELFVAAASMTLSVWAVAGLAALAVTLHPPMPADAVVVRICASGDAIWRLADGRVVADGHRAVADLDTVCERRLP